MKNVLLKSAVIFVVMSLLNAQFSEWSLHWINDTRGGMGMLPIAVLIECLVVSVICFIVLLFFKKSYDSILKISILFVVVHFVTCMLMGADPIPYFTEGKKYALIDLMLYINSMIVGGIIFTLDFIRRKMITRL